ncbi:MAG: leucine-rich repeat domain-containing protein [Muribaculaceae bacterium]|nr:leucine-rich repeat domain-containing protein [Muribaculaceae bacterium]
MKFRYIFSLLAICLAFEASAAYLSVKPGSLQSLLTNADKTDTRLTLTGSMDLRDFHALVSEMPALTSLNLEGVTITSYESATPVTYGPMRNAANELPSGALLGLKLTEITLPANLTAIGEGALAGMQFSQLTIPATVTTIGDNALYGCDKLTSITLPANLTALGSYSLAGCTALQSADLASTTLKELDTRTFAGDTALKQVSLPATLATIGEGCFANTSSLTSITLPTSLTEIGKNAFNSSGLESVTIPTAVTTIGDFAFSQCPHLTTAVLNNNNSTLGRGLFFADPEFVLFKTTGITSFPDYLFAGDSKYDVAPLSKDVSEIGAYSLKDTGASSIKFGNTLVYLGDGAMENMASLSRLDVSSLDSNIPKLGEDVFSGINQADVELHVANGTTDAWKDAAQWKDFKIVSETQTGEVSISGADEAEVKCRFEASTLLVDSPYEISLIEVYNPTGAKVIADSPRTTHASIDTGHLTDRVYIVRIYLSNGDIATFKLMR